MNAALNDWLTHKTQLPGVLACGLRYANATTVNQSYSLDYPPEKLDQAWFSVAETFEVAHLHRFPAPMLQWVFAHAQLYGLRRPDKTCLGIFVANDPQAVDATALARLFDEFKACH
jgi:hypothetical protein